MSESNPERFRTVDDRAEIEALRPCVKSRFGKIWFAHNKRVSMKYLHYLDIYERYLAAYADDDRRTELLGERRPLRFLEIGVADGGSFEVWREYFGRDAAIFGIDINPESKTRVESMNVNCQIRIGSQADPAFLDTLIEEMGGVDVVIDDGSHIAEHQLASFRHLFPRLPNGGLYICEDLHTSYWPDRWQGGYKRPGTFIEVSKDAVDSIHSWYSGAIQNSLSDMQLQRHVSGIHVHDSMVVFEKAEVTQPLLLIRR